MVIEGQKLGYCPPPQSRKSPHTLVQARWCYAGPHCLHYQATDMIWQPLTWIVLTEMESVWNIGLCEPSDTAVTCENFIEYYCCESFKTYVDLCHFINHSLHIKQCQTLWWKINLLSFLPGMGQSWKATVLLAARILFHSGFSYCGKAELCPKVWNSYWMSSVWFWDPCCWVSTEFARGWSLCQWLISWWCEVGQTGVSVTNSLWLPVNM